MQDARRHQLVRVEDAIGERAFVVIDSLLRPVCGHAKQGASWKGVAR